METDTTDYGGWLQALAQRAEERGEDRVNNICRKAVNRAANRIIELERKLEDALLLLRVHSEAMGEHYPKKLSRGDSDK